MSGGRKETEEVKGKGGLVVASPAFVRTFVLLRRYGED